LGYVGFALDLNHDTEDTKIDRFYGIKLITQNLEEPSWLEVDFKLAINPLSNLWGG
jgi:hypothetical protein